VQVSRASEARGQHIAALRRRFGWAEPHPSGRTPALILLSGLPGTGKSHLAEALSSQFNMIVLRSDEVRKALYSAPRYGPSENRRVYLTCYSLIDTLLADRYAVVFDATNLRRHGRRRAHDLAHEKGAAFLLIVTTSPSDVVAERLRRRAAGEAATYYSDADWSVHEKLAGTMEAVSAASESALVVDTAAGLEPAFEAVRQLLR